jgi:hypothetical protein
MGVRTKKIEHDGEQTSELYNAAMAMKPEYNSKAEAAIGLTEELNQIAKKLNLSVPELLDKAETSREFKEEYFIALNLAREISYAKE